MTTRNLLPVFPSVPPQGVTPQWAAEVSRSLNQLVAALRNPGEGRNTRLTLTDLPTSDQGLEPGSLFRMGNSVLIATVDKANVGGLTATALVGTVTVTT
jgi:hypothetical protein